MSAVKAEAFFPASFMDACRALADYYATNIGSIVTGAVADAVLQSANKIPPPLPMQPSFLSGTPSPDETYAIQGDTSNGVKQLQIFIGVSVANSLPTANAPPAYAGLFGPTPA